MDDHLANNTAHTVAFFIKKTAFFWQTLTLTLILSVNGKIARYTVILKTGGLKLVKTPFSSLYDMGDWRMSLNRGWSANALKLGSVFPGAPCIPKGAIAQWLISRIPRPPAEHPVYSDVDETCLAPSEPPDDIADLF